MHHELSKVQKALITLIMKSITQIRNGLKN